MTTETQPTRIGTVFDAVRANPAEPIHINMRTQVKLKGGQSNSMQNRIFKETEDLRIELAIPGVAGGYADRLKEQAVADGLNPDTYQPKARAWGTRIDNSPLIEHKGEHYLEFFVTGSGKTRYVYDINNSGRADEFVEIKPSMIEGLPESKEVGSHVQDGLSKKVDVRCVKLANITRIRIGDTVF